MIGKIKKINNKIKIADEVLNQLSNSFSPSLNIELSAPTDTPDLKDEDDSNATENKGSSSYHYFKLSDNYYSQPVEIGYFPHHVHHNKQVFNAFLANEGITNCIENRKQYNYYL